MQAPQSSGQGDHSVIPSVPCGDLLEYLNGPLDYVPNSLATSIDAPEAWYGGIEPQDDSDPLAYSSGISLGDGLVSSHGEHNKPPNIAVQPPQHYSNGTNPSLPPVNISKSVGLPPRASPSTQEPVRPFLAQPPTIPSQANIPAPWIESNGKRNRADSNATLAKQSKRPRALPNGATASSSGTQSEPTDVDTVSLKGQNWSDAERTALLEALFDPDGVVRDLVEGNKDQSVPTKAFQRIAALVFKNSRGVEACKSQYNEMRRIYDKLTTYFSFTGGGGDADENTVDKEQVEARLVRLRGQGCEMGKITVDVVLKWKEQGWYELFNQVLGGHAGIERTVPRNSTVISPIAHRRSEVIYDVDADSLFGSDLDPDLFEDDDASPVIERSQLPSSPSKMSASSSRKPSKASAAKAAPSSPHKAVLSSPRKIVPNGKKPATKGVPVTPHKSRASTKGTMAGISDYMEKSSSLLAATEAQMKQKADLFASKHALDMARTVLDTPNLPENVREKASQFMVEYFEAQSRKLR